MQLSHGATGGGGPPRETAPAPGRPWLKDAGMAASLTNLLMIRAWFSLLYDADYGYFNREPVNTATLLGLLLNLLLLTGVLYGALAGLRRLPWTWPRRLALLAVLASLLIPINFFRLSAFNIPGASMLALAKHPLVLLAGGAGVVAVWCWWRCAARALRALLLVLLPLAAISWGKLLLVLLGVVSLHQHPGPPTLAPLLPEPRTAPRVIWLIFDELDYRLVFPERPAGLELPELDRLRGESLFATHARPPAYGTLLSLPALTSGLRLQSAEPCSPNDLQVVAAESGATGRWSQLPNIFQDARELGYNVSIIAWHHPYRRVFSNVVSHSEWYPSPIFEQARGTGMGVAMVNQLWSTLAPLQQRRLQVQIQQQSEADLLTVATNRQFGFVFLHLPPPHKPGIYVPATGRFTLWQFSTVRGYFDNLALTDRVLGRLRRALEEAGLWDQTWVLVSADHSWREARRHDGRWDERVPWLLKAPGQAAALEYPQPFNTVASRALLNEIFHQRVRTLEEARAWLQQHGQDLPPLESFSRFDH